MATLFERMSEALKGGYQGQLLPDLTYQDVDEYISGTGRYNFLQGQRGAPGQDDLDALIAAALGGGTGGGFGGGGGGFGGGGGGAGAIPWGSTQGAAELAQQFALEQLAREAGYETESSLAQRVWEAQQSELGRTFEAGEAEKGREFQRLRDLEELKAERQRIFAEMRGKDPVRAALFAMGVGGEILPGGERFANLPPLAGAAEYGRRAATGLSALTGRQIGVGEQGVTGLPEIYKAAGAYSAGQRPRGAGSVGDLESARTLLLSGFGVGAKAGAGRPGISPEEARRKIGSVTPQGAAFS